LSENLTAINREYKNWLDTLGFSHSIVYGYNLHVKDFFEWLSQNQISHITQLTKQHIKSYYQYLETRPNKRRKGGLSVAHLNKIFDAIDKLMEFLNQIEVATAPAPINYRIHQDKYLRVDKIQPFTVEEIKELQANIKNTFLHSTFKKRATKHAQLHLIFALFYGCGLRRTEGMKLKITDINFDNKTLFVHQGKNYKDRVVPLSDGVYKALQEYIYNFRNLEKPNHKRLFLQGECVLANNLKTLQQVTNNQQIQAKKLSFHLLRHSIATHLLQNSVSIENIAQFLGHSSLESTQIYTHIINR